MLKFNDLLINKNILFLYNRIHDNYNIDYKSYNIFNKDKSKFILPLMKKTQIQNTIFFRGTKLSNNIMFGNIEEKKIL